MGDEYWSNRYRQDDDPWSIGRISEPLKAYIDQLGNKNIHILIPGCGNAYEAEYLLQQGFQHITLVDISETLVASLRDKFKNEKRIRIMYADFFELEEHFDLILEQTFLCAIDPSLRKRYAAKMNELLNPGGKLAGVLFDRAFDDGPPFSGSKEEYRALLSPYFRIKTLETCYNSIDRRAGTEVFLIAEKIAQ